MVVPNTTARRHPWLANFEHAPEQAFSDLLAGYADIAPLDRADSPDAARMLFGGLDEADSARKALGPAIISWLEHRQKASVPAAPAKLQRWVREICESFEIIALLREARAAVGLRRKFVTLNEWVANFVLGPARDTRAEYWRALALTQPLVARTAPEIDDWGLAPLWQYICREAGGSLPTRYLDIGLLGLRCLPDRSGGSEVPWVSGLAHWALAREPSSAEFKAAWFALKPLYPRAPQRWEKLVRELLSTPVFVSAGIKPPAWWAIDPDLARMAQGQYFGTPNALRSPLPRDCDEVTATFDDPFDQVVPRINRLMDAHRHYLYATGDSQFIIRAIHALGTALIEHGGDALHRRADLAQSLAREGLRWTPDDSYLWALWRDALAADGAFDAAELVGWERVRRIPEDVEARTQLATLLATSLNRAEEAEALLRDTIVKFPDNVHARCQLAVLLATSMNRPSEAERLLVDTISRFPDSVYPHNEFTELLISNDRLDEAIDVIETAFSASPANIVSYMLRASLYSNRGRVDEALEIVRRGLKTDASNKKLLNFKEILLRGNTLPLLGLEPKRGTPATGLESEPGSDPDIKHVLQLVVFGRSDF
jgi:tetratricopeptide (TPR) repeat protein